jgi:hypothetical protein
VETYRVQDDGRLLTFLESVEDVLDQIAHELEVANRPRGYADRRDELRFRTAERLFCEWVEVDISQTGHVVVNGLLARAAATTAWKAAGLLADLDPESPERIGGKAQVDVALDTPSPDRPATE